MKRLLKNKKIILIFLAVCLFILSSISVSYAWWRYTAIQDKTNVGISKCLKLELTNQSDEINLTNMYPITDEEGRKLTPYTFTLTNTCTMSAEYTLNMEMLEGTTLNSKYLAVMVNNGNINLLSSYDTATTVIDGSIESRTIDAGILKPEGTRNYKISLWMDKSVTLSDDAQNKTFKSKVVVNAVAIETIVDKIIASVDTTGKCPTVNEDGSVNVTGAEVTNGYLCKAKDAYGDSYYYRGNVTNNYVQFAGFYWRIVRINGDSSIRVIYDGTSAHTNGESSDDRQIGNSVFNDDEDDNASVGYMYGLTREEAVNDTGATYVDVQSNIRDSAIKQYVDSWYDKKIAGKDYVQYIADNLFCNDRRILSGTGVGWATTNYRWLNFNGNSSDYDMLLTCSQQNDAFTVADIENGNGALTYPVGLITADEVALAGGWSTDNKNYFLYSGQNYWTSSPLFGGDGSVIVFVDSSGMIPNSAYFVNKSTGVRPVLNLKPEALKYGDGTASNPYRLTESLKSYEPEGDQTGGIE